MNTCKKCGGPAPDGHDICWLCEHEDKLTKHNIDEDCAKKDACPIPVADVKG